MRTILTILILFSYSVFLGQSYSFECIDSLNAVEIRNWLIEIGEISLQKELYYERKGEYNNNYLLGNLRLIDNDIVPDILENQSEDILTQKKYPQIDTARLISLIDIKCNWLKYKTIVQGDSFEITFWRQRSSHSKCFLSYSGVDTFIIIKELFDVQRVVQDVNKKLELEGDIISQKDIEKILEVARYIVAVNRFEPYPVYNDHN